MTAPQPSLTKAALWLTMSLALLLAMTVAGREVTRDIEVIELMAIRSVIGLAMLYPLLRAAGGLRAMRTRFIGVHIARNILHFIGQFCWFVALTMIPLAQLISIEFTMPIWTAILAGLFLGERIGGLKILSILIGVAGVLVIVRPSLDHVETGQLVALSAAINFAVAAILVKKLTRHDSSLKIIFWMLTIQFALGIVPALMVWRWPAAETWPWIVVVSFCGTFAHYAMAQAMRHADASVVAPMDFLRVPLSGLLGWAVYNEAIDGWTAAGALLILFGNALNLREASTARMPPPEEGRPRR